MGEGEGRGAWGGRTTKVELGFLPACVCACVLTKTPEREQQAATHSGPGGANWERGRVLKLGGAALAHPSFLLSDSPPRNTLSHPSSTLARACGNAWLRAAAGPPAGARAAPRPASERGGRPPPPAARRRPRAGRRPLLPTTATPWRARRGRTAPPPWRGSGRPRPRATRAPRCSSGARCSRARWRRRWRLRWVW